MTRAYVNDILAWMKPNNKIFYCCTCLSHSSYLHFRDDLLEKVVEGVALLLQVAVGGGRNHSERLHRTRFIHLEQVLFIDTFLFANFVHDSNWRAGKGEAHLIFSAFSLRMRMRKKFRSFVRSFAALDGDERSDWTEAKRSGQSKVRFPRLLSDNC